MANNKITLKNIKLLMRECLGEYYNESLVQSQFYKYKKSGEEPELIYNVLEWFYKTQHGNPAKSNGGIGIYEYVKPQYLQAQKTQQSIQEKWKGKKIDDFVSESRATVRLRPLRKPLGKHYYDLT